jgi:four helix bundle protein
MLETSKIRSFTDLVSWKEAHKLVIMIYQSVKNFPREETYSLVDQMKRCSVSISSNISEGFSRQTKKEKVQFYYMSKGSLTELQNQLLVAKDVEYLSKQQFNELAQQTILVHKLLNGLIKTSETKK